MRELTLMYLANDVIQNSKKKGPEYNKEFANVLKKAFEFIGQKMQEEKTKKSVNRLLAVWEERGVYSKSQIADFRRAFSKYCTVEIICEYNIHQFKISSLIWYIAIKELVVCKLSSSILLAL